MSIRESIRRASLPATARRKAAGPPVGPPFAGIGRMGALGRYAGQDAGQNLEQYQHNCGYVYSIIRTIANRIIGQPVRHARKVEAGKVAPKKHWLNNQQLPLFLKGQEQGLRNFTSSAILAAFRDPNPIMVRYTVMFNTVASLELTGKAFWWLRWGPGRKPEIWPLPSHWVQPVHEPSLFSSWVIEPGGGSDRFSLPGSDVAYFYYPDPADPLSALAPLTAMARTVMADESLEESQRRTFLNTMNPGLAITIGQSAEDSPTGQPQSPVLTRDQRRALKTILKDEYRGVVNHGEPMILDGFIKGVAPIFQSPKELDFLNSGTATKSRLAQGWGVSPINMGETENANRASSAVADDHLVNNVINPRISMYSEIMTCWLPRFFSGRRDEVVYIEPASSKDIEWELQRDAQMFDRGAKSINEWREGHGMPPVKDGDRAFVPSSADGGASQSAGGGDGDDGGAGWVDVVIDRDGDGRADGKPKPGSKRDADFTRLERKFNRLEKLVDGGGREHGSDGKFGHGGGHSGAKPVSDGGHGTGSVRDGDHDHAANATKFLAKIKEHGAKAVKAAKSAATFAKRVVIEASMKSMSGNLADDICDTAHDYSKIINAKGTGDWLNEHLGVSGNFAAKVGSMALSYAYTKVKQYVARDRADKAADDEVTEVSIGHAAAIITKLQRAVWRGLGMPDDQLPKRKDVEAWLARRHDNKFGGDDASPDEEKVTDRVGHEHDAIGRFGSGGSAGGEGGPKAGKRKVGGKSGGRPKPVAEKKPSAKAKKAKEHMVPVGRVVQRYAEEHNEPRFAKVLGGKSHSLPDSEPLDVNWQDKSGKQIGNVELKTLVLQKNDKITMDSFSQVRKVIHERDSGVPFHSVFSDDRKVFGANGAIGDKNPGDVGYDKLHDDSKREYYYRRGIAGSARLGSMYKCKDEADLKRVMKLPDDKLPPAAQRTDKKLFVGTWKETKSGGKKAFVNSKTGRVVKAKKRKAKAED